MVLILLNRLALPCSRMPSCAVVCVALGILTDVGGCFLGVFLRLLCFGWWSMTDDEGASTKVAVVFRDMICILLYLNLPRWLAVKPVVKGEAI